MLIQDDFPTLYAYNRWANDRTIASVRTLSTDEYEREQGGGWPSVRDTLVHIASATEAWHERFSGRSPGRLATGADIPALEEAASRLALADAAIERLVLETEPEHRSKVLVYRNLRGEEKKVPYWAVFRHVVNHGTYHRGQIASMIRRLGKSPNPTDFVFWAIANTPQE
jgi:uncharacterized damage-inducible protein DinB